MYAADAGYRDGAGTSVDRKGRPLPPVTRYEQPEASPAVFLLPRHTAKHIDIHHA